MCALRTDGRESLTPKLSDFTSRPESPPRIRDRRAEERVALKLERGQAYIDRMLC